MLRTQRQIIATTLRDLHGEQMTRAALDEIVREVRTHYIPLGYEHDPRFPPLGRIIGAQVIELADGEQAAEAILEFWDSDPTQLAIESDDREFPRAADASSPGVRFDRSFLDDEAAAAIAALGEITGSTPVMISKKNLEPIPVLMLILGTFAIGGIAQGFLSKLGEDLYTALRDRMSGPLRAQRRPRATRNRGGRRGGGPPDRDDRCPRVSEREGHLRSLQAFARSIGPTAARDHLEVQGPSRPAGRRNVAKRSPCPDAHP